MIKILFHIDSLVGGGAEKALCNLVNQINKAKYEITVQTLYPEDSSKYLEDWICYKYIYPKNNHLYRWLYRIEAELGLVYPLHMKSDYDIEIAYLEFGPTKVISSSTNKKAKKLAWIHCDLEKAIINKDLFVHKTAKQYAMFDNIICVSDKCKESYISLFGNYPESRVIHNVINSEEILRKKELPLPNGVEKRKFTICTVGRLSAPKNYMRLLSSVSQLIKDGFDFDLWIIGDGEQRSLITTYIKEHSMESCVYLLGFQTNPYPFMNTADLLVCSSSYEGFSTFISEGVILGKPIVTTNCSGMREILHDYNLGKITDNSDSAFYCGMRDAIQEFNNLRSISIVGEQFCSRKLVQDNEMLFEQLYIYGQNERLK